jgi:hypothetical protein
VFMSSLIKKSYYCSVHDQLEIIAIVTAGAPRQKPTNWWRHRAPDG